MSQPPYPPGPDRPYSSEPSPTRIDRPGDADTERRGFFEPDADRDGRDGRADREERGDRDEHDTLVLGSGSAPPAPPSAPAATPAPAGGPASEVAEGDRVWPHLLWEGVLLAACAVAVVLVLAERSEALTGGAARTTWFQLAVLVLVASGLALSLRAAVPNLAVGALAGGAGSLAAWLMSEHDWGWGGAATLALVAGAAAGLLLALVVVGFHTPAWAASLGLASVVLGASLGLAGNRGTVAIRGEVPDVVGNAGLLAAAAIVLSVAGGALLAVGPLRRVVGGTRSTRDPGRRPGGGAALGATGALVVSSALAAGAGVLQVFVLRAALPGNTTNLTTTALAAVLLGGVSAFGRRGGVFGTALGAALLVLVQLRLNLGGVESWVFLAVSGGAVLLGLLVNRLLEAVGRRRPAPHASPPPPPPAYQY